VTVTGAPSTPTRAAPPASLTRNPRISQWLDLSEDGTVAIRVGKVDIGQGISTALAQIAAEELDVDIDRIVMVPADTAGSPDEGITSGSQSIEHSGTALRQVCAEARAILLGAAAARLGVDAAALRVTGGVVLSTGDDATTSYWEIAHEGLLDVEVTGNVATKLSADYRVVGRNQPRLDLAAKIAGRPVYIHDLVLPGQVHGRVVRPPSPAARLLSVDESAAAVSGEDVISTVCERNFVGVVATREESAIAAADRLRAAARWHEEPSLPDENELAKHLRSAPAETSTIEESNGEATAAARPASRSVSATYSRPYLAHASIGTGCAVARWTDDGVEVWSNTQGIFALQRAIALALDLDERRVLIHHVEGAGAYGHNSADDAAFDAVVLARSVPGRPVRVQWSREDELTWSPYGSPMVVDLTADVDDEGNVLRWHHELWSHGHTSRPGYGGTPGLLAASHLQPDSPVPAALDPPPPRGGSTRNAPPLYAFPEWRVTGHRVLTMPIRCSALRSLGAHMNVFAAESFMDELAAISGRDPVAYRLAHLRDHRARAVLEAAAQRAGWGMRPDRTNGTSIGQGVAVARYKSVGAYCAVVAEVEAEREIAIRRLTIAVDVGRAINPDGVANQVEGGAIQSASWTLKERVRFDRTRITSTSWDTYPILRFSEAPAVDVEVVERPDEPSLGAGEVVQGPTAAAIGNAVFGAIGVRVRHLPLTPERVIEAIEAAE
jgi:nicotinate dehydrogenase subunit B